VSFGEKSKELFLSALCSYGKRNIFDVFQLKERLIIIHKKSEIKKSVPLMSNAATCS